MSKMSDLFIEIEELLSEGFNPLDVAGELDIPLDWVYGVIDARELDATGELA